MIEFLGHLYPAAVHFPVAMIVMAAVAELVAGRKKDPRMAATALLSVVAAGYFGAEVTHGPGHLLSH